MDKNIYNNTIFTNGINLAKCFNDDRYVDSMYLTSSTMTFSNLYFLTNKGRGIFKTFDGDTCREYRTNRMLNELLCYELGKQTNCPCANCDYAIYDDNTGKIYNGIVSYETIKEFDRIFYATDFLDMDIEYGKNGFLKKFMNKVESKLNEDQYNKKEMIEKLYKIVVFDLLTMQCDRHMENIHIIEKAYSNKYDISPLIDNEYAFCTRHFERLENLKNVTNQDIIDAYNKETFVTIDELKTNNRYKETIEQIVKYAKKYDFLNENLKEMINNVNIEKVIKDLEEKGISIDKNYKKLVCNMLNLSREKIIEEYKKQFKNNNIKDSPKNEEIISL